MQSAIDISLHFVGLSNCPLQRPLGVDVLCTPSGGFLVELVRDTDFAIDIVSIPRFPIKYPLHIFQALWNNSPSNG